MLKDRTCNLLIAGPQRRVSLSKSLFIFLFPSFQIWTLKMNRKMWSKGKDTVKFLIDPPPRGVKAELEGGGVVLFPQNAKT